MKVHRLGVVVGVLAAATAAAVTVPMAFGGSGTRAGASGFRTPNASERAVLASKQANLNRYIAKEKALGSAAAAAPAPSIPPIPSPSWDSGINSNDGQFYQLGHIAPVNAWFGTLDGHDIAVHAGSVGTFSASGGAPSPSSTGVLVVDDGDGRLTTLTDPSIPGPFKIVSANGSELVINGSNGSTFTFNFATETISK